MKKLRGMSSTQWSLGLGLLLTAALCAPEISWGANHKDLGLGIILGDPTGLTGKVWLHQKSALDFGLAFSLGNYALLYTDYLWHFPQAFGTSSPFVAQLTPYIGGGGVLAISTNSVYTSERRFFGTTGTAIGLGVRVPVGIEWAPPTPTIGVFLEIAPGISLVPATAGFLHAGIGIRYYF